MQKSSQRHTGVLLAGGSSSRFGRDKARSLYAGDELWLRSRQALASVCDRVVIAGDRPELATDNMPSFADAFPGSSLAGLHTGLAHATTDWITVLPCDLPFPSPELLRCLQLACHEKIDAVVPRCRFGREPLIACYHKNILAEITDRLLTNRTKIRDLLDGIDVRYIEETDLPAGWRRSLKNINTPADLEKLNQPPPALSFIGRSGTGKTTLLEKLIRTLAKDGWAIGALKHDAHHFEIDHEGKDSWRLPRAGAVLTAISSPQQTATIRHHEAELTMKELLAPFTGQVDIILTEGFRRSPLPKIEIFRSELKQPLLCRGDQYDPNLLAVATDVDIDIDVPLFCLGETAELAEFIEKKFLT